MPPTEFNLPWRALPAGVPRAIEYPLIGDDLEAVTRRELQLLRDATALLA